VNESYTATDALADWCCWLGVFSARSFFYEYCRCWYSQLIAPWCWRLACSQLETQYVIRDALCSENLFINRTVH